MVSKDQRKYALLTILGIIFAFITILPHNIIAQQTLDSLKHQGNRSKDNPQLKVGHVPRDIVINPETKQIYIVNSGSNTVSIIDGNTFNVTNIHVGVNPIDIIGNRNTNTVYVANSASDSVSVIDGNTDTKIKDIKVGKNPVQLDFHPNVPDDIIYVVNGGSDSISVIDGNNNTKIKDIKVGKNPGSISIVPDVYLDYRAHIYVTNFYRDRALVYLKNLGDNITSIVSDANNLTSQAYTTNITVGKRPVHIAALDKNVYVANSESDSVSVLDLYGEHVATIPVGKIPSFISTNSKTNTLYVANSGSASVSVINGTTNRIAATISVGDVPSFILVNPNNNKVYVANSESDSVSVIDGKTNAVTNVTVGNHPTHMAGNGETNVIYALNSGSNSMSVIDGSTNKILAGVALNVNPVNSGHIKCNNIDFPTNDYFFVQDGTKCVAEPNTGYQFSSWIENLGQKSSRTVNTSSFSNSPLNSFSSTLGIKPNDTSATFTVTEFGNFTSNFEKVPPPIPPEYWIPLYGVIISSIVGWSIPSIIGWIKAKRQGGRVHQYHKRINSLFADDNKLDENDIQSLNILNTDIRNTYAKGKISEQHYSNLKNEISTLYEQVYKKKIYSLNGSGTSNARTQLDKIKNDVTDAYAEGKISEQHYNLLNENISDHIKGSQEHINKLPSSQKVATTSNSTEGSPIKINK